MRVLVVEDDTRVAAALAVALGRHGFEVLRAESIAEALAAPTVDMILLDLALPDGDGVDLCRRLRRDGADVAIIALTARGEERDRIAGLRAGADDYLVKPYSTAELLARVEAVMRRARPRPQPVAEIGDLRVDLAAHTVARGGEEIVLTRKEFDLLACLARGPGVVVPRERLLIEVWGSAWPGAGRTLDVHMATLRAKLGEPPVIETVRGVGYRLAALQ
ncbi:response regulator transcription factor [Nonomuraea lactucae]|uniref:response regulator transcription factor n=1 Tax=Nonomuraea lactucae TaxID=2249762 RepID=UPI000DE3C0A6|nr:response regulator transcription factor [Nonomuraea lactucae]